MSNCLCSCIVLCAHCAAYTVHCIHLFLSQSHSNLILCHLQDEKELDENDPFAQKDRVEDDKLAALAKSFETKYVS